MFFYVFLINLSDHNLGVQRQQLLPQAGGALRVRSDHAVLDALGLLDRILDGGQGNRREGAL